MNHLTDDQLTDAYYGEFDASSHLTACPECSNRLDRLREILDSFHRFPIPRREPDHGSAVWTSILPKLPSDSPKGAWFRWWMLTPALAALLTLAFITGRLTERVQHPAVGGGISETARERVLLMSLSDHLEQSQIVLANVANADPNSADLADQRDRAHELLGANRLLRQTAARLGDNTDAALLDELERVLLDVANSPARSAPAEMEQIQQRIEQDGLLFRVRITSTSSRERGQKL